MKYIQTLFALLAINAATAQTITTKSDSSAFTLQELRIQGDDTNWIMRTDGSQYKWAGNQYAWGGVGLKAIQGTDTVTSYFTTSGESNRYLKITLARATQKKGEVTEHYTFTNTSDKPITVTEIGINTPFNDNYPSAKECIEGRVNAHIWAQGSSAYVAPTKMSGKAPHLGLLLTKGKLAGYEIKGRSIANNLSNVRGIIVLNAERVTLQPKQSYTISWDLFVHHGLKDFEQQIIKRGGVVASAPQYVVEQGKEAVVEFRSKSRLSNPVATLNGTPVKLVQQGALIRVATLLTTLGNACFELTYNNGKSETANLLCISSEKNILDKRATFIVEKQQYLNPSNKRYGAYLPYDNELGQLFLNDRKTVSYHDRDEGAERLGMGVFLAQQYQKHRDPKLLESLEKYTKFLRNQLQTEDYTTYSTYQNEGRNRAYNYAWIADFYVEMYKITGDKQYLADCYGTMKALYRNFGHGFYAFGIPVRSSIEYLRKEGMNDMATSLFNDYEAVAEIYLKNSTNYPPHEVNYEQSIVTPLIIFLTQMYQLTGNEKYLAEVKKHMPLLESFSGYQPDYHLNELGIRHWDGYWFGKREFWGDTFPHYWTTLTAHCYSLYAQCTGEKEYQKRAETIVRNNLCQFFEDGSASCAYLYPNKVNGVPAKFYDPFANDQDWALVYYNRVMN